MGVDQACTPQSVSTLCTLKMGPKFYFEACSLHELQATHPFALSLLSAEKKNVGVARVTVHDTT